MMSRLTSSGIQPELQLSYISIIQDRRFCFLIKSSAGFIVSALFQPYTLLASCMPCCSRTEAEFGASAVMFYGYARQQYRVHLTNPSRI
jgi:hypothetical protein